MRNIRLAAVGAIATVGALVVPATAAHAAGASDYSTSASSGVAGASITVTSTTGCPAPSSGTTPKVAISVATASYTDVVAAAAATVNADRSWSGSVTIPSSARNGNYHVIAACYTSDGTPYSVYSGRDYLVKSASGQVDPAIRLAGNDRIETAIAISNDLFPGTIAAQSVVLARADSYADALAGTPLAAFKGGPLLLTGSSSLDSRTAAEITRLLGSKGTVYLLGGTSALSADVANSLSNSGYTVTRIAGLNRFDTAVKAATEIGNLTNLLLATGMDFHDGLVAGTAALVLSGRSAVLLTNDGTMPTETKNYIDSHSTITRYTVGAPAAAADASATPVVGSDNADTSRKVAEKFFVNPAAVAIANQAGFADALSGGVHAGFNGAPLLFTDPTSLPATVITYLTNGKSTEVIAFVYGGTAAVNESVRSAVVQAIT